MGPLTAGTPSSRELAELARTTLARAPYRAPWWLRGGRRQTLWSAFHPRGRAPALALERWTTPDDDFLRVHLDPGPEAAPLLLVLHGLEGSVRSLYVHGLARAARRRGFGVVVLEHRSCGGEPNRALRAYHSGQTDDLAFVVARLGERFPGRRLYPVGVSLGGNVLCKWLGEVGERTPSAIPAAAAVSVPFDLGAAARSADEELGGLFARVFLRTLVPKALEKARRFPGALDVEAVARVRTFREFDDVVTAPLHGFRDAEDYWTSCSCARFLHGIRRPTLLVSSLDDPLVPRETVPLDVLRESPWLVPLVTPRGGHAAFLTGGAPWRARRWAEERVLQYFSLFEAPQEAPACAARAGSQA